MSELPSPVGPRDGDVTERIANGLREKGYSIILDALPPPITEDLLKRIIELEPGDFKPAGIGRQGALLVNPFVRRDHILWLDATHPADSAYLIWMETLRQGLNRRLFLGLFDYECHFAHYPPGAFYKRHLDAFKGDTNRVVTTVLYLNPGWTVADGGELRLYTLNGDEISPRILPVFGTLVVFLSADFPHAVAVANRHRYSVTGWFRVNTPMD
ncbi:MAG: 2OG-Fe(II) oxygenase [Gammaproteobacteria bacterium]|nr:2OG-Fe(II) oxygenase [Gammaproteobacteria bacterium]